MLRGTFKWQLLITLKLMRYAYHIIISHPERRRLLCRGKHRLTDHAADSHRRHFDSGQSRAILIDSRYTVSMECMAWPCTWTSVSRLSIMAMGLHNLCHPSPPRRRPLAGYLMVERPKGRETRVSRSQEMEKFVMERTGATSIRRT